jgi:disulfide bond formation protein DsbB
MALAATDIPAAPVLIVMAIGVLVAMFGHASKSRTLVVCGLMMLFLATAAMVVGAYVAYETDSTQDPRPKNDPKVPNF